METINHTFTIQWVGPFDSIESLEKYKKNDKTIDLGYFNFYCFEVGYRENSKLRSYLGVHHKADGIDKRLNDRHEHYSQFKKYKNKKIWIGSFGNDKDQTDKNIEILETLYIRTYRRELTENDRKKKATIPESICVINLWYNQVDLIRRNRRNTIQFMDDVIVYDAENRRILKGQLASINY